MDISFTENWSDQVVQRKYDKMSLFQVLPNINPEINPKYLLMGDIAERFDSKNEIS
jgi:hypothetical protein